MPATSSQTVVKKISYLCVCYYAPYNGCIYIDIYIEREWEKERREKGGKRKKINIYA